MDDTQKQKLIKGNSLHFYLNKDSSPDKDTFALNKIKRNTIDAT